MSKQNCQTASRCHGVQCVLLLNVRMYTVRMPFVQHWVRLCGLQGRVSLHISMKSVSALFFFLSPFQKEEHAHCTFFTSLSIPFSSLLNLFDFLTSLSFPSDKSNTRQEEG